MKWTGLLLLLIVPAASWAAPQAPDDKLIVPGARIGKWTLAMTLDSLVRMNGGPVRALITPSLPPAADIVHPMTHISWSTAPIEVLVFEGQGRVEVLVTALLGAGSRYDFKTDRAVGFRSSRAEVLKAYGLPTAETRPQPDETRLIYDKLGIAFRPRMNGGTCIYVFRPAPQTDTGILSDPKRAASNARQTDSGSSQHPRTPSNEDTTNE